MSAERRARTFLRLFGDGLVPTGRLCEVCAEVAGVTGAGITLLSDGVPLGSACSSDPVSARLQELQLTLGAGPCIDAWREDRPVLVPDLRTAPEARWVGFAAPALDAGARAVFAFPLDVGAVRVGVLSLHRDEPGALGDGRHADALAAADAAALALLAMQAEAPSGALAPQLDAGWASQAVVHQASGMVAAQLATTVDRALLRLRAHAFGDERPLADVARDVVARRLRFTPDDDGHDAR